MVSKSEGLKQRIRQRLQQAEGSESDFDGLLELVDRQLDMASGGFSMFGSHQRFDQGPGYPPSPGDPSPPQVPSG